MDPSNSLGPSSPSTSVHDAQAPGSVPPPAATNNAKTKKGKSKKAVDPSETGKLLAAKINQLEIDAAGEKNEEQEIGTHLHMLRHSRDLETFWRSES